ncbi:MAG TPA: hypothetical protein VFA44_03645 [Gaiellaceae bacterium]|nr:hypothetical protein [Gaiellaceae bacterium]
MPVVDASCGFSTSEQTRLYGGCATPPPAAPARVETARLARARQVLGETRALAEAAGGPRAEAWARVEADVRDAARVKEQPR